MRSFAPYLRDQFGITPPQSNHLASEIADEIQKLPREELNSVAGADPVGAQARLDELKGFQMFMDIVHAVEPHPAVIRAQVVNQNYICFVYLGDACFKALRKAAPSGSVTRKCCQFLIDNQFAHSVMPSHTQIGPTATTTVDWFSGLGREMNQARH